MITRGRRLLLAALALAMLLPAQADAAAGRLADYLPKLKPADLDPAADAFGPIGGPLPAAPLLKGGKIVGYAFLNADIVDATGYSGQPIDIVVGLDRTGHVTGARLVEHHEPIFLVGVPPARVDRFIATYVGQDMLAADAETRTPTDIVSGATVSSMVIADSITRASIRIARAYHLGGAADTASHPTRRVVDTAISTHESWQALTGDGSVRRLALPVGQINDAFRRSGNQAAIARPEPGAATAPYVDVYLALASVPSIGRSLLGDDVYNQLLGHLKPGQQAILIAGDGPYSFRGSGYVRGGIFDRIEILQGDDTFRFHDRDYYRVVSFAPKDAPDFPEIGLFVIPAGRRFDPAKPWRFQLLVQRPTGPLSKAFITVAASYTTPDKYLKPVPQAPAAPRVLTVAAAATTSAPVAPAPAPAATASTPPATDAASLALWARIWRAKAPEIAILLAAIGVLTGIFFFQDALVKRPVFYGRLRLAYLAFTLMWIGWHEHAQLSVVNILTFFASLRGTFHWDYFLKDPLVFILWCSVAAALIFWGRGAYCGWLCPFGALQEWTNRIARWLHVPQITVPFGLHQRLWPIKYIIFMGLVAVSVVSFGTAEKLAEVEPFKTAIILHFVRDWWFVLLAVGFLLPGLVIERFYCRYLCPMGGALAIPARIRMFDWLKRYPQCGSPCHRCAHECPVQAIHPTGQINPNECIQCLNCQVLYHHDRKCPVMIQKRQKREARAAAASPSMRPGSAAPARNIAANAGEASPESPKAGRTGPLN